MKVLISLVVLILVNNAVMAAGSSHASGSVLDLQKPFLNFFILFGLLFWKLKKPMADMFNQNAKDVEFQFEASEKKSKEAAIKYDMYKKKLSDLPHEEKRISAEAEGEIARFESQIVKNNNEYIFRLQKELENRLLQEQKKMELSIRNNLAESIISKVKESIKNNASNVSKVNQKLLAKVRN